MNAGLKLLSDDLVSSTESKDIGRCEILLDVKSACRTAVEILNDLLCFDKLESGILELHKHEVPVYTFFSDCVDMFASQAKECGVELTVTSGELEKKLITHSNSNSNALVENEEYSPVSTRILPTDTVFMDRFKMDQVLRNLISNALKFTPKGGVVTVGMSFIPNLDPRSAPRTAQEMVVKPSSQYSCYRAALSCQQFLCCTGALKGKQLHRDDMEGNDVEKQSEDINSGDRNENTKLKSICSHHSKNRDLERGSGSVVGGVGDIVSGNGKERKNTYDCNHSTTQSQSQSLSQSQTVDKLDAPVGIGIGCSLPSVSENRCSRFDQNGSHSKSMKKNILSPHGQNSVSNRSSRKIVPRRSDSGERNFNRFLLDGEAAGVAAGVINGKLRIVVTDTGAGISEANLRRLFVEVVQFNPEVLQAGGGSGLGLWITNSIVNLHAGVVRAHSGGPGKGSSFTVEIDMQRKYPYARGMTSSHTGSQTALQTLMPSTIQSPGVPYELDRHGLSFKAIGEVRSLYVEFTSSAAQITLSMISITRTISTLTLQLLSPYHLLYLQRNRPTIGTGPSLKKEKPLYTPTQRLSPLSPAPLPLTLTTMTDRAERNAPVFDIATTLPNTPVYPKSKSPAAGSKSPLMEGNVSSGLARLILPQLPQDMHGGFKKGFSPRERTASPVYDVLVVDDSSLNRKMLRKIFLSSGYDCDDASDGLCAIEKVKERLNRTVGKRSYDAILMDFVMPNMNGPTATEEIRKLGYKGLIFGVTGNFLDSDVTFFISRGADAVLSKPFDPTVFHRIMREKYVPESVRL
jgi:CheY-like chemotaxis protein